jgi:hypothetical protein
VVIEQGWVRLADTCLPHMADSIGERHAFEMDTAPHEVFDFLF